MERSASGRLYVVVAYQQDSSGIITANLPEFCPLYGNDNLPCQIGRHHRRSRKNGPPCVLCVAICRRHKPIFTLYPLGWTPYSRKPLVHVGLDFTPTDAGEGIGKFKGTIFDAALDAAEHRYWPIESEADRFPPRFSTQIRHLQRASILFGLDNSCTDSRRQQLIPILEIPGQLLHDSAEKFGIPGDCESRGRVIRDILEALPYTTTLFQKLAAAGHLAGLWPTPFIYGNSIRSRQTSSFQIVRTRGSP